MGALQAGLLVGAPERAAGIRRSSEWRLGAASASGKQVSSIAAETASVNGVPGLALRADWHAESILVEIGTAGALEATCSLPRCAENVGGSVEGTGVGHACTLRKHESSVASEAVSIAVPGGAEIADWGADSIGVEEPPLRALDAGVSVPLGTSIVLGCELAGAIDNGIALIAGLADSLSLIELAAEIADLAADSILIERIPIGAFETLILGPGLASIIIGDGD